jgi:hypothetical protein
VEKKRKLSKCFNIKRIINARENGLVAAPNSLTVEECVAQAVAEGAVL